MSERSVVNFHALSGEIFPPSDIKPPIIPPGLMWLDLPTRWWTNVYEPPSTATEAAVWSNVHLSSVILASLIAPEILRGGQRVGRIYRAGPYVVALKPCLFQELGLWLDRGEWLRLDTHMGGRNLAELYAFHHSKPYRDAITAIGLRNGVVRSDGAMIPIRGLKGWAQRLHPLHQETATIPADLWYSIGSKVVTYQNAAGLGVAQVIRLPPLPQPRPDVYHTIWGHSLSSDVQWVETFPRPPYFLYAAEQMFRQREADILLVTDEFLADSLARLYSGSVFSAVPGGLKNLPSADLTSLRDRKVKVVLVREDIPHGLRIEAALRRAGVAEAFFLSSVPGVPRPFADLDAVAAAERLDLLPVLDGDRPVSDDIVVFKAGESIPGLAVERPMIINPIVRGGDLVWIYGEPKTGKTWLALILAHLVSVGEGRVGPWSGVDPVRVFLVALLQTSQPCVGMDSARKGLGRCRTSRGVTLRVRSCSWRSDGIAATG